ncbi:hypothetical protein Acr_08g0013350 [Actinidia rufa]|uniref:Uncharacterized protein n=1 Tax=Actinidia rufa TaxID=165716 RepID=A0A7J0F3W5_9ERIC|nr:hypothetical protein Acr_08g0013350 [Actinidia rufa]
MPRRAASRKRLLPPPLPLPSRRTMASRFFRSTQSISASSCSRPSSLDPPPDPPLDPPPVQEGLVSTSSDHVKAKDDD